MGFEPTISGVTGQYVNRYTTGPRTAGLLAQLFQFMLSEFRCQGHWGQGILNVRWDWLE